jgi:hypothetical protein
MAGTRHTERIRRRAGESPYELSYGTDGETQFNENTIVLLPQQMRQSSTSIPVPHDLQQLSFQQLSPLPDSIWSYTCFVGTSLACWLLYLILPRGCRKKYCYSSRKRYARRTDSAMPAGGYWLPVTKATESKNTAQTDRNRGTMPNGAVQHTEQDGRFAPKRATTTPPYSHGGSTPPHYKQPIGSTPPSPEHPAIKKIPPNKIIAETMGRLQGRGIRLLAHGVQCDPKRVWIKLEDDDGTNNVTWQTEFPRRVPNQSGEVSIVLMRGSLHRIALSNVLYIDVGKKTNALMRHENQGVPDAVCFSLLTQNGSLDLQANSKLERDALVSCFSMILDNVHTQDWRALYEASPDPSLVTEEIGTEVQYGSEQYGSDMVEI